MHFKHEQAKIIQIMGGGGGDYVVLESVISFEKEESAVLKICSDVGITLHAVAGVAPLHLYLIHDALRRRHRLVPYPS